MHQTNEAMYIYRDHLKSEISCKLCVHSGYESSEKVQTAAQCNRLLSSSRVLLEVLQQETAASRAQHDAGLELDMWEVGKSASLLRHEGGRGAARPVRRGHVARVRPASSRWRTTCAAEAERAAHDVRSFVSSRPAATHSCGTSAGFCIYCCCGTSAE